MAVTKVVTYNIELNEREYNFLQLLCTTERSNHYPVLNTFCQDNQTDLIDLINRLGRRSYDD